MGHLRTQLTPPPRPARLETQGAPGSQKQSLRALRKLRALFPRAPPEKDLWFGLQCGELLKMQIMGTNPGVVGKAARRRGGGDVLEVWPLDGVCGWGPAAPDGTADVPEASAWEGHPLPTSAASSGPLGWATELLPRRRPPKPSTLASQGVWDSRRAGRRGGGMRSLLRWGNQSTKTWSCLPQVTATQGPV